MDRRERIQLLQKAADSVRLQAALMETCRRDILFWFHVFCWTVDPRQDLAVMPFSLYPVQEWAVLEIYGSLREQCDWGIEKSRDMGASWLVALVFQYGWLFHPGWDFLVGSYRQDEVDKADHDPSTIFGKFRTNLYRLPRWMRPPVRDKLLSIRNERTGTFLTGQSASPKFGRGPRKRAILLDELAFWQHSEMAWGNCSQTTRSRGAVSTPFGNTNQYARLMQDRENTVLEWPGLTDEMRRKGLL